MNLKAKEGSLISSFKVFILWESKYTKSTREDYLHGNINFSLSTS